MLQYLVVYLTECCYAINYVLSAFISPYRSCGSNSVKTSTYHNKMVPKGSTKRMEHAN